MGMIRAGGLVGDALAIVFIGEGMVLAAAIEQAQSRGHQIAGVFATAVSESRVWARSGLRMAQPTEAPAQFIASCAQFDVLISVNNRHLLDEQTIGLPRLAAINYHNAPLPAYPGLRATTWAIVHGEAAHGVTWHRLDRGVDTGNILIQRRFSLDAAETTASLNARCTATALECLPEVFELLESGDVVGEVQNLQRRHYFSRRDTAPNGGLIDWRWTGPRLVQLVRACDWGSTPNDFGTVAIAVGVEGAAYVRSAVIADGEGELGEVLAVHDSQVTVACAGGAVRLTLYEPSQLSASLRLPVLTDAMLADTAAQQRGAILNESHWLPAFRRLARQPPRPLRARGSGHVAMAGGPPQFLQAVSRVLGASSIVAMECTDGGRVLDDWRPILAGRGVQQKMLPLLRDAVLRHPDLVRLFPWPARASARLVLGNATQVDRGTLVFDGAHCLHHQDAAVLLAAVAEAMNQKDEWSAALTVADPPTLVGRLTQLATENSSAPAFKVGALTVTRGELWERAVQVASRLRAAGLLKEGGVGVLLPAGVDFAVAALGAMLAEGAYVPLNLASPSKRRETEIVEAGITHIVTRRPLLAALPDMDIVVLDISDVAPLLDKARMEPLSPSSVAYRIFTSGSTGRPKAVEVEHGALENLIRHYLTALQLDARDRMPMLAHPSFDASVADLWPVLAAGGTVLVPPDHILLDPVGLIEWLQAQGSTCAFVPTAIGEQLIRLPWPPNVALRYLLIGGDALHRRPPDGLPFSVVNTYGPTENTVDALWARLEPGSTRPPIGTPISGVVAWINPIEGDEKDRCQEGELMLGGTQVARGYYGQPELTAERFPIGPTGKRCYRTGDLVRINPEGEYEFLGRIDRQVQLRGVRIELEEIESLLLMGGQVREAVCLPEFTAGVATALIAHVVPSDGIGFGGLASDLHRGLAEHLSPAVLPRRIFVHATLPRTAAGKTDRQLLAASVAGVESGAADGADPLADLWRRSLPTTTAGDAADGDGNFWDLGGSSLAAMQLLLEIHRKMNLRVSVAQFFADPTMQGLRRATAAAAGMTVVRLREGVGRPLVCWHGLSGDVEEYRLLLAQPLGDRPIYGVVSPALINEDKSPGRIEELVSAGLGRLRQFGADGPMAMLGYSWGGLLAFEAARQLGAIGLPPVFTALIGTQPPVIHRSRVARAFSLLRKGPSGLWSLLQRPNVASEWRIALGRLRWLFGHQGFKPPPQQWPTPLHEAHVRMGLEYTPSPIVPVRIHLFRELAARDRVDHYGHMRYDLPDLGWQQWTHYPPVVHWFQGDHLAPVKGAAAIELAMILREHLHQCDVEVKCRQ